MDEAALQAWVGRTAEAEDMITPRLAAEFEATFAPHLAGEGLLGIHWCLAPAIEPAAGLGPDGHPRKGGFLPPVPLPRRMWAGGEVEVLGPLGVGDRVARRSRIGSVSLKHGRTGTLCFVAVHHDYAVGGDVAVRERHDIVYREAAAGATDAAPGPREAAEAEWRVRADPVLLFRYSAMTFNGHRIHYDLPYVTEAEGYAGLVVHGPVQATLLLNLAAVMGGQPPARFSYRGVSPMAGAQDFCVRGRREGDAIACWTESATGTVCMKAVASAMDLLEDTEAAVVPAE